jgi:quercetin dioxygenase-like cupin family protein
LRPTGKAQCPAFIFPAVRYNHHPEPDLHESRLREEGEKMPAKKYRWYEMPAEQVTDTFSRKVIVGMNEMFCWLELKQGCIVPEHAHENEQISHVLKGRLLFVVDGETIEIGPGESLLIHPNAPHSAEVLSDETVHDYDTFSPPRADWVDGSDDYLKK